LVPLTTPELDRWKSCQGSKNVGWCLPEWRHLRREECSSQPGSITGDWISQLVEHLTRNSGVHITDQDHHSNREKHYSQMYCDVVCWKSCNRWLPFIRYEECWWSQMNQSNFVSQMKLNYIVRIKHFKVRRILCFKYLW
jgi:hypothetical protein